jgi:glutathione S-transferase
MRVRWALEEVGQRYEVDRVSFAGMRQPAYRALHPFGQIPAYRDGDLTLFESGAIVLHIAERHGGLLPTDPDARARAIMWMFAALSTIEPPIVEREQADFTDHGQSWYSAERLSFLDSRIRTRLDELATALGNAEWLEGTFTAGDLMMIMVLRRLEGSQIVEDFPSLAAYVARGTARHAYQRAFADQLATNTGTIQR